MIMHLRNIFRHFRAGSGLAVLVWLTGGCLQTEHSLVLNPDGSGTLSLAYHIPASTLHLIGDADERRFDEERIRQDLAEKTVSGITLLDVVTRESEAGQAAWITLGFDALADMARTEFYRESSLALERTDAGTYRFTQMPNAPRKIPRDPEELRLMKGFQFTMNVSVPGTITSTNADTTEGSKATWRFHLDADPRAIERMDTMVYEIEFTPSGNDLPEYRRPRVRLHPPPPHPIPGPEEDR